MSTKSDRNMLPLEVKKIIIQVKEKIDDVIESWTEDSEPQIMVQVPEETQKNQQKKI